VVYAWLLAMGTLLVTVQTKRVAVPAYPAAVSARTAKRCWPLASPL
jgi:hypothetical protein